MGAQQLIVFNMISDREVQKIVIRELRHFKALKVKLENREERKAAGIGQIFPSGSMQQQNNMSSLAPGDLKAMTDEMKVRQMKRALEESLDAEERQIIELKYLSSGKVKDVAIYMQLGLNKDPFYDRKKSALLTLATALDII